MNYATYYRYDSFSAWRFTSHRSGQPAASDRSPTGGKLNCGPIRPIVEHPTRTGARE